MLHPTQELEPPANPGRFKHLLRQHLLELRVLGLQRLQPPRIRHLHAAISRAPLVEGRVADAVLAAQLFRAQPGLMLLQDANDLLFAEPASLHRLSPRSENRLTSKQGRFRGAGHVRSPFTASSATRALKPASWFLRFDIVRSPRSWRPADVKS